MEHKETIVQLYKKLCLLSWRERNAYLEYVDAFTRKGIHLLMELSLDQRLARMPDCNIDLLKALRDYHERKIETHKQQLQILFPDLDLQTLEPPALWISSKQLP